jgi:hypothetical protein
MRQRQETQPTFEFRAAENAGTCSGDALDILAEILVDIHESKKQEQARAKQEGGDACQTQTT